MFVALARTFTPKAEPSVPDSASTVGSVVTEAVTVLLIEVMAGLGSIKKFD